MPGRKTMLRGVRDARARRALSIGCRHLDAGEYQLVCVKAIEAVHSAMRGAEKRTQGVSWDRFRELTPSPVLPFTDEGVSVWARGTDLTEAEAVFCLDFAIEVCRG